MSAPAPPVSASAAANPDLPKEKVLVNAAKIAIEKDKPILLDYYRDTRSGAAFLGEDKETKEKFLVKNPEEYTSPVIKMYGSGGDIIIETENSIYIISGNTKKKEISNASL